MQFFKALSLFTVFFAGLVGLAGANPVAGLKRDLVEARAGKTIDVGPQVLSALRGLQLNLTAVLAQISAWKRRDDRTCADETCTRRRRGAQCGPERDGRGAAAVARGDRGRRGRRRPAHGHRCDGAAVDLCGGEGADRAADRPDLRCTSHGAVLVVQDADKVPGQAITLSVDVWVDAQVKALALVIVQLDVTLKALLDISAKLGIALSVVASL
jgi:hypothetical protein